MIFLLSVGDQAEFDAVFDVVSEVALGPNEERLIYDMEDYVGTWPQKINFGVKNYLADWYLCAADDVRFTEGWWDATQTLREDPQIGVIGTNDQQLDGTGGNPRIQTGNLAIHPLIRATYIQKYGTIDEPGKAVHDGYHHWCCDDELLWTARLRNAYAYCPDAHIVHNHPYWGTGLMDNTYRAGEANSEADLALWHDRATRLLGLQFC